MKNNFFVNLEAKRIQVPSQRWYEIGDYEKTGIAYPSVTTILKVKAQEGLMNWQVQLAKSGVDPREVGKENMDEGSTVHNAAESLMNGEKLVYSEEYDFWGEWIPICRFIEAYKELEIKPIIIEQTIWSNSRKYAGTLDLFATIKLKDLKKPVLALIDLKRSAGAYVDYQWQISSYKEALLEMAEKPDSYSKRLNSYLCEKFEIKQEDLPALINSTRCFLLLLNVPTKKGWRLTEVDNLGAKMVSFNACNGLFQSMYPDLKYVRELYPTELTLNL